LIDPRIWLAAAGSRKVARKALATLERLFREGTPPEAVAAEFGLDRSTVRALDALASAPDGWRKVPAIITETDPEKASAALISLCRRGLALASPIRDSLWLSDAGRYLIILCSADLGFRPLPESFRQGLARQAP
jgi:hypothetical protein